MYHVLICEDEPLIGLGLQKIIREFNFPVQKIDYFENSLEAYQYIQKNAVDIIITDIQMPHLNGLDFIQKVKRMYPDMQCIILSGYSDFSYAQSAIKLGVVDYLLKPIDKGELQKLLETCMERIGEIKKQNSMIYSLLQHHWEEVVSASLPASSFVRHCQGTFYAAAAIHLCAAYQNNFYTIEEYLEGWLTEFFPNSQVFLYEPYGFRMAICLPNKAAENDMAEKLRSFLLNLRKKLSVKLFCGYGTAVSEITQFRQSAEEAENALYKRYANPDQPLFAPAQGAFTIPENVIAFVRAIAQAVQNNEASAIELSLNDLFSYLDHFCTQGACLLRLILIQIFEYLQIQLGFPTDFRQWMEQCETLKQLKSCFEQNLLEFMTVFSKQEHTVHSAVSRAIQYMQKNYSKDIDLALLANVVSMSYAYFSSIFKKETGFSAVRYLQRIRIDHALSLLEKTDLKIYEIAHQVGFPDEHYFIKVFKTFLDITPMEYRKKFEK